jgi:hypothetical protein
MAFGSPLADIVVAKHADAVPPYLQEHQFAR